MLEIGVSDRGAWISPQFHHRARMHSISKVGIRRPMDHNGFVGICHVYPSARSF